MGLSTNISWKLVFKRVHISTLYRLWIIHIPMWLVDTSQACLNVSWVLSMPLQIQPIRTQENPCLLTISHQRSHHTLHCLYWPLYFLCHGIKCLHNTVPWYARHIPHATCVMSIYALAWRLERYSLVNHSSISIFTKKSKTEKKLRTFFTVVHNFSFVLSFLRNVSNIWLTLQFDSPLVQPLLYNGAIVRLKLIILRVIKTVCWKIGKIRIELRMLVIEALLVFLVNRLML